MKIFYSGLKHTEEISKKKHLKVRDNAYGKSSKFADYMRNFVQTYRISDYHWKSCKKTKFWFLEINQD